MHAPFLEEILSPKEAGQTCLSVFGMSLFSGIIVCFSWQTFCLQTRAEPWGKKKRKENQSELSPTTKFVHKA